MSLNIIYGDGRSVKPEESGYYWFKNHNDYQGIIWLTERSWFNSGTQYLKIEKPTFMPLLPIPPKPKLKLYRVKDYSPRMRVDEVFWGFADHRGFVYPGSFEPNEVEEVKDNG